MTIKQLIDRRVLSVMVLGLLFAHLDRTNLGFAAVQMSKDLGFSATVYGLGASAFFLGYALLEIPSNFIMHRVGPAIWLGRIMITWGLVACAMGFVSGEKSFYAVRLLLGIAEAGFVPGMLYYLTSWYLPNQRSTAIGKTVVGAMISGIIGGPLAGLLLPVEWLGIHGWQIMFVLEGLPPIALGIFILVALPNKPADARWLPEQDRLRMQLEIEAKRDEHASHMARHNFAETFTSARAWIYGLAGFFLNIGIWSLVFWTPQVIHTEFSSLSTMSVSLISSVPYVVAVFACLIFGGTSDRTGDRRWHLVGLGLFSGFALVAGIIIGNSILTVTCLVLALAMTNAFVSIIQPTVATAFKEGALASGTALFNSCSQVGGFVGPFVVGYLRDLTGSFTASLSFFAFFLIASGLVPLLFGFAFPSVAEGKSAAADGIAPQELASSH